MNARTAVDVARRCLCLELLFQRYVLEIDPDASVAEREEARRAWMAREADLGVEGAFSADERAVLDRHVGELDDDALDDLFGRATGAAVLVWALGRAPERPALRTVEPIVAEHGLLGDGSVTRARAAADGASLRDEAALDDALAAYLRLRGKAREVDDPERIFAGVAAHHLTWILDAEMSFDDDVDLD